MSGTTPPPRAKTASTTTSMPLTRSNHHCPCSVFFCFLSMRATTKTLAATLFLRSPANH
uniref:Uncharacterized protein n=1 Tax=Lotus japonicus TaxID=34305 RepID=I3T3H8_LOTJA|nr:unknown [Lotus japonicus]